MGSRATRPPVSADAAEKLQEWIKELVIKGGAPLLLRGDTDGREFRLACATVAEFLQLELAELVGVHIREAQELGASNESVAWALGVRPSTASRRYPNPKAQAGSPRKRKIPARKG